MRISLYSIDREYLAGWSITHPTPPGLVIWNNGVEDPRYFLLNPNSVRLDNKALEYYEVTNYAEIGKLGN